MTLKWHLLTSNDIQFYSQCYNCVLRLQNRYETCATLIFCIFWNGQNLKYREFGALFGIYGNPVYENDKMNKVYKVVILYHIDNLLKTTLPSWNNSLGLSWRNSSRLASSYFLATLYTKKKLEWVESKLIFGEIRVWYDFQMHFYQLNSS